MERYVHIGPGAVQREQIDHAEAIAVILLAQHVAVHAEDAYVAVLQGIVIHVDHVAVGDLGHHGVTLDADGELCAGGHVTFHGDEGIVLAEYRGGKACRRRRLVQRDGTPLLTGTEPLLLCHHDVQCVHQRVDGLAPGQGQIPVFGQQTALLVTVAAGDGAEAAAVQVVGVHLQRVEQPQQYLLLRGADAGLVVAHR